ncbi:MAG TPA: hypothetical protein VHT51_13645 [Micropepsaceae bacterium]|nr:hypothetical protein [Micropepsaceae bacterium]
MLQYVRLTPGSGFRPLRAAFYYAQRIFVQPELRSAITSCIVAAINMRHPPKTAAVSTKVQADSNELLRVLNRDGIALLPETNGQWVSDINAYLADKAVVLRNGERMHPQSVPSACTVADYPLETVLNCPHLLEIANSPLNVETARRYLGCLPTISTIGIRWSFPGKKREADTQGFHRDPDDWRCFKFFVYLTDVNSGAGPHLFVRGSHLTPKTVFAKHIGLDYIQKTFGPDSITPVLGKSGTSFIADVQGIHAGPIPTETPRLMLEVGYSILPIFALRYKPMLTARSASFDPYINRLIVR